MASVIRLMRLAPQMRGFSTRSAVLAKKYTKSHEWIDLQGNIATIGITKYAADALGDVVYVELPEKGLELEQGGEMGAVESVKSASDIYAPVSGKILEINESLGEKPATINKSAEEQGWLAKLEISKPEEIDALLSKEQYDQTLEQDDK